MSQPDLRSELNAPVEPPLPIEKKLIGWSLGIGLVLLVILVESYFVGSRVIKLAMQRFPGEGTRGITRLVARRHQMS